MDKRDVEELYYIAKEIAMWQECLKDIESLQAVENDGMPKASTTGDSTGRKAVRAVEVSQKIYKLTRRLNARKLRACDYISELDDSLMRQIITYRCIDFCTWQEVADRIGGNNTADSVRKAYARFFARQQK